MIRSTITPSLMRVTRKHSAQFVHTVCRCAQSSTSYLKHNDSLALFPLTRVSIPRRFFSVITARSSSNNSSNNASSTSSAAPSPLLPSQIPLVLPQLAPRMTQGRIVEWLVKEGDPVKPLQVFLIVETNELTEDGSPYLLEIESHETGLIRKKLTGDNSETIKVGTTIAVFEDSEWEEGDAPRKGDFLWQAYVKEGALRSGSCTPVRKDDPPPTAIETEQTASASETSVVEDASTTKPKRGRKPKAAAAGVASPDADAAPSSASSPTPTRKRSVKKKSE